jgi:hypothetical protein
MLDHDPHPRRWSAARTAAVRLATATIVLVASGAPTTIGDAGPVVATAPPADRFDLGAAGSGRNGHGGAIAPTRTGGGWPGTANDGDGGPFAFVGAQYGAAWRIPTGPNNSRGVGYCVMEDVAGVGIVTRQPDPAAWSASDMARAAALMSTFGGDKVVPYGIDESGRYDAATGEWHHPALSPSGGDPTRRRQIAVNFGVRMFLPDLSPRGAAAGKRLSRSADVVDGTGGEFAALRNGYRVAQLMAAVADRQHAVGGIRLALRWATPGNAAPTTPGRYPIEVRVTDGAGKPVGLVPVLQLSDVGIDGHRSVAARASVDRRADTAADTARRAAAFAAGWPTWTMAARLTDDRRFAVGTSPAAADVADEQGIARFHVDITDPAWELAFHAQAPTADAVLFSGSGIQGNVTWAGRPQSASVRQSAPVPEPLPDRHLAVLKTSSDPAVAVAGTVFALYSGDTEIARATVGANGRATFPPIPSRRFPPPYRLREVVAAAGLIPLDRDIAVPGSISEDPRLPTVVTVANAAAVGTFGIRKELDREDIVAGRDMAGFVFRVTHVGSGRVVGTFTTDADGLTPPVRAVLGDHRIAEIGRPAWAAPLRDTGPVTFRFTPGRQGLAAPSVIVAYVNAVPTMTIDSTAVDAADADRRVELAPDGATIVDEVRFCGAVPGTGYVAHGSLHVVDAGRATPVGIESSTTFTPAATCGSVQVRLSVPAGSPAAAAVRGRSVVVFEEVRVAGSGRVVATHADPDDADQTVTVVDPPPPPSTTVATTSTTTTPTTTTTSAPPEVRAPTTSAAPTPPATVAPVPPALPPTGRDGAATAARWGFALASIGAGALVATRARRRRAAEHHVPGG